MGEHDQVLDAPIHDESGEQTIDRETAVAATRAQSPTTERFSDEAIWQMWQEMRVGPTNRDDMGRVLARVAGIATDA